MRVSLEQFQSIILKIKKESEILVLDPKQHWILIRYFTIYIVPILTMEFDQFRANLIYESASFI